MLAGLKPYALQCQLQQTGIRAGAVTLRTPLTGHLGFGLVPVVGFILQQKCAQIFEFKVGRCPCHIKQCAQPAEVVGPAIGVNRLPCQMGI